MSIRKNTVINIIGSVIPLVVTLLTVPIYLKLLGVERYGVIALIWLMLGYFSFLEMGLGKAVANQIAKASHASDSVKSEIFWTGLILNAGFGIAGAFVLWLLGKYLILHFLKMPDQYLSETIATLPWLIVTLPLALISSVLSGTLEGRHRFDIVNYLQVITSVVFQVVPIVAAYFYGPSLEIVVPVAIVSRVLMNIPFLIACVFYVPMHFRPVFSFSCAKKLFKYGGWVAITGIVSPILDTVDRLIIASVLGVQAVAHYTLSYQVITKAKIIPMSLSRVIFPKFSDYESHDALNLALRALEILSLVMTPIVVFGIIFLQQFMNLWIGKELSVITAPLGVILLFGVWLNSLAHVPFNLLQGQGQPDKVAKLHTIELLPFLCILWLFINYFGLLGVAIAWSLRVTLDSLILFKISGLFKQFMRVIIIPLVIVLISISVFFYSKDSSDIIRLISFFPIGTLVIIWCYPKIKQYL
jgi:O-antigen/teichoic acid export membrane protein